MTPAEMRLIVNRVTYKPGWHVHLYDGDRPYIQVAGVTLDADQPDKASEWRGAKVYLSPHMCRQEIVGACFKAFRDAELHELHEWFRYRGRAIFGPHIDPDALIEVADERNTR